MTPLSRFLGLFPALHLLVLADAALGLLRAPGSGSLSFLAFALYLLPPLAYRLHERLRPLEQGVSFLDGEGYSSWWGGHQIQSLYCAAPVLEALLRLVPGLYSFWLRLWGSSVGKGVYWTPRVEIADRGLMEIGDGVIFGHKVECFAHVIKPKNGRLILYARRIIIGPGSFLGAGSRLGPGVVVEDGSVVPILTDLFPNRRVGKETSYDRPAA